MVENYSFQSDQTSWDGPLFPEYFVMDVNVSVYLSTEISGNRNII